MFIKNNQNPLVFVKSKNISVFPCGRRRSMLIDSDNNEDTVSDKYYIPFDPEARLNTEANNRKHSGLNGFTQSHFLGLETPEDDTIKGKMSFVLDGYYFEIALDKGYKTVEEFGAAIANLLNASNNIWVNIKRASVTFIAGNESLPEYNTEILRDWTVEGAPAECLDVLRDPADKDDKVNKANADDYYFAGLAFSSSERLDATASLKLLTKSEGVWVINEEAKLPIIKHGATENSVILPGDLNVKGNLTVNGDVETKNGKVPIIKLDPDTNQLQFFI
jgi:hypothetical protein